MKSAKTLLNSLLVSLVLAGCTIIPHRVKDRVPSFDGNAQDSGLKSQTADGSFLISAAARDRYNSLIAVYGGNTNYFVPPLTFDAGITPTGTNLFLMDRQHMVDFGVLKYLHDSAPK